MPDSDDHYYLAGYSVEDDPYAQPSGVLINNLNINNTQDLEAAEADLVSLRAVQLLEDPVQGKFDLAHLQEIHRFLFQDIYPWAGELRKVGIGKGETEFTLPENITAESATLFAELARENYFRELDGRMLADQAGTFMGRLNLLHPFREGNGRTQRMFMSLLAREAGYDINWSGCARGTMREACIAAIGGNSRPLSQIIFVGLERLPMRDGNS